MTVTLGLKSEVGIGGGARPGIRASTDIVTDRMTPSAMAKKNIHLIDPAIRPKVWKKY